MEEIKINNQQQLELAQASLRGLLDKLEHYTRLDNKISIKVISEEIVLQKRRIQGLQ